LTSAEPTASVATDIDNANKITDIAIVFIFSPI